MSKYYKHPQFGMVFGEDLVSPIGRLAWPSLVTPKDPPPPKPGEQPGKPRFEATILYKKGNPKIDSFLETVAGQAGEMQTLYNQGKATTISIGSIVKDGDSFDMTKYPYYADHWVLIARNATQPEMCDANNADIPASSFIGGMKVRAMLQPMVTAHGLSYKLKLLQLVADDGTRFAGGTRDYRSLLGALDEEGEETEAVAEEVAPQVEAPVAATPPKKPVGRPAKPAPIVQQAAPSQVETPKVDAAALRARAAAQVKPQVAPKKGIGLALDKI